MVRSEASSPSVRRVAHDAKHGKRGDQAVSGEQVVGEDDMARLLAAQRQIALEQLLHHVLVADLRAYEADAALGERDLEADVAHHGGHDGVALQASVRLQPPRAHQHDGVAVDHAPTFVHEDRAIAVAVEGDAEPEASVDDSSDQLVRVCGSAVEVDVPPIGSVADERYVEPELTKQTRGHTGRRAVGAIHRHARSRQTSRIGKRRAHVCEVPFHERLARDGVGLSWRNLPRRVGDDALDVPLEFLAELFAAAREHLMPLSSNGLCDAEMTTPAVKSLDRAR